MAITASDVNRLRQTTGAGMMDCKKALEEAGGDFQAAIDILRKKGQKISAKRADRDAKEGVVVAKTDESGNKGVIIRLTSETDFVAKNADFISFAEKIADLALDNMPEDVEALKSLKIDGVSISDKLNEQVAKIGEKIDVAEYINLYADGVVAYNHAGNRIGVLVGLNKDANERVEQAGKDVAMQIAAMNPVALDKDEVSQDVINRELEIAKDQIRNEGKPEDMVEKIAQGKLNKFYKENTLLNQDFVKEPGKSVKDMLRSVDPELSVVKFKRVALGE